MKCFLKSTDSKFPSVELQDKQQIFLGRNRIARITDTRISRKQVELKPNFDLQTVEVKQLGPNNSGLNGVPLHMGISHTAKEGDNINLIFSNDLSSIPLYIYKVEFQYDRPVTASVKNSALPAASTPVTQKRAITEDMSTNNGAKAAKIPKMFLPRQKADDFRKDSLQAKGKWTQVKGDDFFVYCSDEKLNDAKTSVGAFDMDGTLIKTISGRVFPKDEHDWTFLSRSVIPKLQRFFADNLDFKFTIFTNQAGLKKAADIPPFKRKIEAIAKQIGIPVLVFVGTKKDQYRKPMIGGWDVFVQQFNQGVHPDLHKSFYCGDACGRPKDHSNSDRFFALNIGIKFLTPEEFFDGGKAPTQYTQPLFSPKDYLDRTVSNASNCHIKYPHAQEMIIMVGFPASGKSNFVKSVLIPKGYVHINRDTMKSMAKCVEMTEASLTQEKKVVIDNTNPTIKDRNVFIKVAKKHSVKVRCFRLMVDINHAFHNNKFRHLIGDLPNPIPDVAFHSFKLALQEPTETEGYDEIIPVYFVPDFKSDARLDLYTKFLLDK